MRKEPRIRCFWLLVIAFGGLSDAKSAKWPYQLGLLGMNFCRQEAFTPLRKQSNHC